MGKNLRTFKGRVVDIDEVKNKNLDTIAVGNMNVNARGDELDEWGNVVKPRDEVARKKNSSMSRSSTEASVISTFEDDEDDYEIKDDPSVLNSRQKNVRPNDKKPEPKEQKTDPKQSKEDTKKADETDLDD